MNSMRVTNKKLTEDPIVLKILKEIKLQGKTEKEVEEGIGLTTGAFIRWKYGGSKSYMRYIGKIADYLNVTPEYLLNTEEERVTEDTLSGDEIKLLKMYRKMKKGKRQCMLMVAKFFLEENENEDCTEKNTILSQ